MGTELPESFEAGTVSTPLIAGLDASIRWVKQVGIRNINAYEAELATSLIERLDTIPGSILFETEMPPKNGIVLYQNKKIGVNELASALDEKSICTRSGFHCAPLAHQTLHTGEHGALRISFGIFNTRKDIDRLYSILKKICK